LQNIAADQNPPSSDEDRSKDAFFMQLAQIADAMIAAHGKEFAMGALIIAARFIAEGKPLTKPNSETHGEWSAAATPLQQSPAR
jgi:hypothetical protein